MGRCPFAHSDNDVGSEYDVENDDDGVSYDNIDSDNDVDSDDDTGSGNDVVSDDDIDSDTWLKSMWSNLVCFSTFQNKCKLKCATSLV